MLGTDCIEEIQILAQRGLHTDCNTTHIDKATWRILE